MKNSKKQVRETKEGKAISAYVILKDGKHVGTVQSAYSNSGVCHVDVWNKYELTHQQSAGGYGYDKFTAALAGAAIDGVNIFDHCGTDAQTAEVLRGYKEGKISQEVAQGALNHIGASFANWHSENNKYSDAYSASGLDRLKMMGYQVIQAI